MFSCGILGATMSGCITAASSSFDALWKLRAIVSNTQLANPKQYNQSDEDFFMDGGE